MTDLERQQAIDEEHLKLLRIGYFISAGINAMFSLVGLLYATIGLGFVFAPRAATPPTPNDTPPAFGWLFVVIGLCMLGLMLGLAALKCRAARCLAERRGRAFCMVLAAACCIGVPYGTLLSVFTFLVLGRPSVAALFRVAPPLQSVGGGVTHGA
jgi:hypothetical protein